ncbi:MAG: tripartite tricarboxylate transporter substrate binding protein, partial [Alphaproteobacteria bacterium]|nr:tripartite tricarboxylate transporter substrate binding protein [Alphaproteobacteria bacterium]
GFGLNWKPAHPVTLIAGTPAGGGQDRPARALLRALEAQQLLDVPITLTNLPGRGGGNAWDKLAAAAGDPHLLAISSPALISNLLLGVSALAFTGLTPLANLYTEYSAFLVRADSDIADARDLVARLGRDAGAVRTAIATARGNPNHIALATVTRHAGGDLRALAIAVFDSARHAVAHVLERKAPLAAITAASAVPELEAGSLRALAVTAPRRLPGVFAQTPTWTELGVDCVMGLWRGLLAPPGLAAPARAFWERVLYAATRGADWQAELARQGWSDDFWVGAELEAFLARETSAAEVALDALGLRR